VIECESLYPDVKLPKMTILELLSKGLDAHVALSAPDRVALNYADLRFLIQTAGLELRAMGLGRHDRVALVLPNGP
jgi:oxalate---CoA ligase